MSRAPVVSMLLPGGISSHFFLLFTNLFVLPGKGNAKRVHIDLSYASVLTKHMQRKTYSTRISTGKTVRIHTQHRYTGMLACCVHQSAHGIIPAYIHVRAEVHTYRETHPACDRIHIYTLPTITHILTH